MLSASKRGSIKFASKSGMLTVLQIPNWIEASCVCTPATEHLGHSEPSSWRIRYHVPALPKFYSVLVSELALAPADHLAMNLFSFPPVDSLTLNEKTNSTLTNLVWRATSDHTNHIATVNQLDKLTPHCLLLTLQVQAYYRLLYFQLPTS